ncbi:MAG: hypothetical protein R3E54_11860 [Halioglobus sp.]
MILDRKAWVAGLAWLLAWATLALLLLSVNQHMVEESVQRRLHDHLRLTLDEAWFSTTQAQVNDRRVLTRAGAKINEQATLLVRSRWFAPHTACRVQLLRIDGTGVGQLAPEMAQRRFGLFRNQIEREVVFAYACRPGVWFVVGVGAVLGALFLAIYVTVPPPLTGTHRRWINQLLEQGYSGQEAFDIIRKYPADTLNLNPAQRYCLEQLHSPGERDMNVVLGLVTDARVATLSIEQMNWLLFGLGRAQWPASDKAGHPGAMRAAKDEGTTPEQGLESALALATAENRVEIDLTQLRLLLRGVPVPIGGTPLFYYAWYALARLRGEVWITNPPSNRPDLAAGVRLADWMSRHQGHGRAINDLQQTGLRARTLDQNRSKIKEDIVAALGEARAEAFLFDTSRHPDGVQLRYRLRVEPALITRIAAPEGS